METPPAVAGGAADGQGGDQMWRFAGGPLPAPARLA